MRFFANMNISPKTVEVLHKTGWDIIRVSQVLPVNATDNKILDYARQENRIVITQDLDFSALIALSGFKKPSLITLRLSSSDPELVTQRLLKVIPQFEEILQKGYAVTIEDTSVRIHKLPIE